jgi:general secretion pathway protein N
MPSLKKLISLGVICFVAFLIVTFPAHVVFSFLLPGSIQSFGVAGSIWKGSARIINVNNFQLRNTEWDINLSRLLIGQVGGDFKARWGGGFAEGFGSISGAGTLRLENTQAGFDLGSLNGIAGLPQVGGQISTMINELELINNWPQRLEGTIDISNLSSPMMGQGKAGLIGNVSATFTPESESSSDGITGLIKDAGGPLEISGELVLTPPGNYALNTRVKARANAPSSLKNNLSFIGKAERDGSYKFELAGDI